MSKSFLTAIRAVVLAGLILACGDGPTGPRSLTSQVDPLTVVDRVVFDVAALDLRLGQTRTVSAFALNSRGEKLTDNVGIISTDTTVLSLAGSIVSARAVGMATLIASAGGRSTSLLVAVTPVPVASLSLRTSIAEAWVGDTISVEGIAKDSAGNILAGRTLEWRSSDPAVLTIPTNGSAVGISSGTASLTARSEGVEGAISVKVIPIPVAVVVASVSSTTLLVGDTVTISAIATDPRGRTVTGLPVTWSTADSAVMRVVAGGHAIALSAGTARLIATVGAMTGSAQVSVSLVPVAKVSISAPNSLFVGGTATIAASAFDSKDRVLTGRSVKWTSSAPTIASVSAEGVVTANSPGTAVLDAEIDGKHASSSIVVALVPIKTIAVVASATELHVGDSASVSATAKDLNGATVTGRAVSWFLSNPVVLAMPASGVVTAISTGTSWIIARSEGISDSVQVTVTEALVASVSVVLSAASADPGQKVSADAITRDKRGNLLAGRPVAWSSSQPSVASISPDGIVSAVAPGSTLIRASVNGISGASAFTVDSRTVVDRILFDLPYLELRLGQTRNISAFAVNDRGEKLPTQTVTIVSSDPNVISLLGSSATARSVGTATITAMAGGRSAAIPAAVSTVPVTSLNIGGGTAESWVGDTTSFVATAKDSAGNVLAGRKVEWRSSNPAVLNIRPDGTATALSPGSATLTATSEGVESSVAVSVISVPVAAVSASASSSTPLVGDTIDLSVTATDPRGRSLTGMTIVWSSSDSTVMRIVSGGRAAAVGAGAGRLTAAVGAVTGVVQISVSLVPVFRITISGAGSLYVGATVQLTASLFDSKDRVLTGRVVKWTSGNSSVASVSTDGLVTALSAGSASIDAEVEGRHAAASITVADVPVASVSVALGSSSAEPGRTVSASATARDSRGNILTGRTVLWSSSAPSVASVSSDGTVSANAPGSAVIEARVEGVPGAANFVVTPAPVASVSLSSSAVTTYAGVSTQLTATAYDSRGGALTDRGVTWSSANSSVATVSALGVVTAVGYGSTRITGTVEGKTAFADFAVRHDPVILLHGYNSSGGIWSTAVARLVAEGWRPNDIVAWTYASAQSNAVTAGQLKALVDSLINVTGARRVDLITHSMGSLPSRYYLKNLGGQSSVDALVSLAGPNHGTDSALLCGSTSCFEMRVGSAFLANLNSGDETPGSVRYATWWSSCDGVIYPVSSAPLAGATNTQTACISHSQMWTDAAVYAGFRDLIER